MLFRDFVGNGRENEPDDVLNAKRALTGLGRYRAPRHGFTGIIDRPLDEAIRGFQKDNDLRVDGWLKPGGPTQRRLEQSLGARWQTVADDRADREDRPELRIDLPGWTPKLVDPKSGDDVLAPDGKPFTLTPLRTRELVEQAKSLGRIDPRKASKSQLDRLSESRKNLSALWGFGMPRLPDERIAIDFPSRPPMPEPKPPFNGKPPVPEPKPRLEEDDGNLFQELWREIDKRMKDPSNAPSETPPLDPPPPPPPPPVLPIFPPGRGRIRLRRGF